MLLIKMAALTGVLIASPYIMLQVWFFIAPGLYAKEKKLAIPFVLSSSALFIAGAAFSHYFVFPAAWKFLRQLLERVHLVHAAHRSGIRHVCEA